MTSPEQKRIISLSPAQIGPVSYISLADLLVRWAVVLVAGCKTDTRHPILRSVFSENKPS
jgi:hypothetical protein